MSESSEQARVEWEARDKPAQTRATATDEQREIVRQEIRVYSHRNVDVLTNEFKAAKALVAVLADSEALAARDAGVADEFALDLIMWSLRLPLLREAIGRVEARPGVLTGNTTELARLDALIAEGERALGILPEEEA